MSTSLKYYYDLLSQPSRALYIIFKLSGTNFESCPVALRKGEHLTEEYKQNVNRFQKVPCINENGFKLSESIAILRYLHPKGVIKTELYPTDSKIRARIDEFFEWQHHNVRAGCSLYFRYKWMESMLTGNDPNPDKLAKLQVLMEKSLDLVENEWLSQSKFIGGDSLTAADIFAACEIEQPTLAGYDPTINRPNIKAWLKSVREATNPHYDDAHKYVYKFAEIAGVVKAKL